MATLYTRNDTSADKVWAQSAHQNRHGLKIYTYNNASNATHIQILNGNGTNAIYHTTDYDAKQAILKAAGHLNVDYPGAEGKLRRDYYLVRDADSLYFTGDFSRGRERLQIKGNVAWIVEMFFDKLNNSPHHLSNYFPIYMYTSQPGVKGWCQLTTKAGSEEVIPKWIKCVPPRPTGNYIGIGNSGFKTSDRVEIFLL